VIKRRTLYVVAMLLLALLVGIPFFPADVGAQSTRGRSNFGWIVATRLTIDPFGLEVDGDTTLADVTAADVAADAVTADAVTASEVVVDGDLILAAQTAISVTNGMTLTPTGSYQLLTSAAASRAFGAITAADAGTVLTLVNTVNQTITITDTGTLKLSGNAALGQYDSITLISDGTNWIELNESDN
jgi:hypothetical protein